MPLSGDLRRNSHHEITAIPGNPGIASIARCLPAESLSADEILAAANHVDAELTIIGPEAPLVAGVVDRFRAAKRPIIGPTAAAAQLEGSKMYAKRFFPRHTKFQLLRTKQQQVERKRSKR